MDPQEIRNIIKVIQTSSMSNKEKHFENVFSEFKEKYPMCFKLACTSRLDDANLNFMLNMLEDMNNKKKTQHDASVAVGQMLFDKYVEPKVGNMAKKK